MSDYKALDINIEARVKFDIKQLQRNWLYTGMGAKRFLCIKEKFKKLFATRHLYMYFLKCSSCSQDNLCHRASSQK